MDDAAHRLDDDDEMLVLEQDLERDRLGARLCRTGRRHHDRVVLVRPDPVGRVGHRDLAAAHAARPQQSLQPRAGERRQGPGQHLVEPLTDMQRLGRHLEADGLAASA